MCKQHNTPCSECPWKRESLRGWLGASNPLEFLELSESGQRMPCHLHVDYQNNPHWQEQLHEVPECAGRAVHFANRAKRGFEVMRAQPDHEKVFTTAQEFIDHHTFGKGPQVMIIGIKVVPIKK